MWVPDVLRFDHRPWPRGQRVQRRRCRRRCWLGRAGSPAPRSQRMTALARTSASGCLSLNVPVGGVDVDHRHGVPRLSSRARGDIIQTCLIARREAFASRCTKPTRTDLSGTLRNVTAQSASGQPSPRERLLKAADELFYCEGVNTVGIDRVIAHAGVAKASLYTNFGSKDELIRAYLERRHTSRRERIEQAIAVDESLATRSLPSSISSATCAAAPSSEPAPKRLRGARSRRQTMPTGAGCDQSFSASRVTPVRTTQQHSPYNCRSCMTEPQ